ncbi:MAG: metabolite traffic protein EboE [Myxococcales bacterium]|nr:metabolite traffic protein EboE [Myxococcales bacterium]
MRLPRASGAHLMYCTNVHPGESLADVRAAIAGDVAAVKARVSPGAPFAVGLRLGAEAAEALGEPRAREDFRALLRDRDLYVVSINGFPYGRFHGARVKETVYRPDWREPERLAYTNRLADLLADLLPEGVEGSISTVPGAFRPDASKIEARERIATHIVDHAAVLARIREERGPTIALALEPEPACMIETIDEAIAFFERHLVSARAARRMAEQAGLGPEEAEEALRRHLGLCVDACHAAVEFEDAGEAIAKLRAAGLRVAKAQLSVGLRVPDVDDGARAALAAFAEDTYLHQTVERRGDTLRRFVDLPEALAAFDREGIGDPREWRVHYHVPIFRERYGALESTRPFLEELLTLQREAPFTTHLEVETYTWGVLPPALRSAALVDDLARELDWARGRLHG